MVCLGFEVVIIEGYWVLSDWFDGVECVDFKNFVENVKMNLYVFLGYVCEGLIVGVFC